MSHYDPSTADRAAPAGLGQSKATRRLLRRLPWEIRLGFLAIFYLGPPALLIIAATLAYYTLRIPDPMALRLKDQAPAVRVLAADGSLLSERGGSDAYIPIDLMPRHLIDAVIATEDRRFFKHWGIDPSGMIRAAFTNLSQGRLAQGGSTLTQQLAKNLFLGSQRTWARKIEELILALWLEVRLGKRNILELYLNRVYFGAGAYGVETAAQRFFAKSACHVTLGEAAMLAGLLKAPSRYSPASHPPMARERANNVLAKMVEAGFISKEAGEEAARETPQFSGLAQRARSGVEYAVDAALELLPALVATPPSNLVIETTIDPGLQHRAQGLVQAALANEGAHANAGQAGVVFMDANGAIRALIGGRSYAESQFNRATKARRQPGSAFKMFVYLAALESGLEPSSTVLDLPILGSGWSPRNEGAGYRGSVTLRDALALSMNAAAARLNMTVGARKTAAVAQRLGIRSPLRADASLALGTSEVTLIELTGAYSVLANGGRSVDAHIVRRVRTTAGKVLYERLPESTKVLVAPLHVTAMNEMLSAVLSSGTGKRAALPGHAAAGKTGTSQDFRDAWFVGYAGEFIAGVWVGNDDGRPMHRVMGGSLPARLWRDIMLAALEPGPALLSGTAHKSIAESATGAAPAANGPLLPREPIGAEFVERAIADDEPAPEPSPLAPQTGWVSKAKGLLRQLGFGA
ncbi:MAG TPA: PBP1A family penicillin-binding protein [Hyphomicrobiaceae bacterium]|nr:PBP1A family penicillin-binding protein [Hyphomicrobiaceae bacterium]